MNNKLLQKESWKLKDFSAWRFALAVSRLTAFVCIQKWLERRKCFAVVRRGAGMIKFSDASAIRRTFYTTSSPPQRFQVYRLGVERKTLFWWGFACLELPCESGRLAQLRCISDWKTGILCTTVRTFQGELHNRAWRWLLQIKAPLIVVQSPWRRRQSLLSPELKSSLCRAANKKLQVNKQRGGVQEKVAKSSAQKKSLSLSHSRESTRKSEWHH